MDTQKRNDTLTLIIVILVLLAGFYFRYVSVSETSTDGIFRNDAKEYFTYAYNLRHHHIYSKDPGFMEGTTQSVSPDAMRNPGYPLFLSLFIDAKPNSKIINSIIFSQLLISVITLLLLFLLYQKYLPVVFAAFATSMAAICPHLIVANSYILTETLFCFLIVCAALTISLFIETPTVMRGFLSGVLMALANLVRPGLLYLILPMAVFLMFHYNKQMGIKYFAVMVLGFLLIFSPWVIRNHKTVGAVTDNRLMINFLHHGMYPDFKFQGIQRSYGYPYRFDSRSNEISRNTSTVFEEIKKRFYEEPYTHSTWYLFKKPVAFWAWNNVQGAYMFIYPVTGSPYFSRILFKITYIVMKNMHGFIMLLGVLGMGMAWLPRNMTNLADRQIITARFISLLLIYYTAIHMAGFPLPRYSIPLRPLMYGMALFGIYFVFEFTKMHVRKNKNKADSARL